MYNYQKWHDFSFNDLPVLRYLYRRTVGKVISPLNVCVDAEEKPAGLDICHFLITQLHQIIDINFCLDGSQNTNKYLCLS